MELKHTHRNIILYGAAFVAAAGAIVAVLALLFNVRQRREEADRYPLKVVEMKDSELDPVVWGKNFPLEYDTFVRTKEDYGRTEYGGSTPYSRIERYPAIKRLWAGYPFSIDYNEDRGHAYALIDQINTLRIKNFK